ncbi:SRPBCC domain-containing protein [Lentzea tibetensis]|uniref:SRPBCC domain-containing protein n=1 Tax=Lentzea tibetensis TaxID=2591470 RepID=A0A563EV25_9PSEU|nr:SRPBCC domain-containing protein [Lentzea tibetensis]TWP51398.1 SRPBCC domain-containing protein [Lentzea tibetensis]
MSKEFELRKEVSLEATPEQVWDAIATGPGISSWFMGPHTVDPAVGGRMTLTIGDFSESATITAWDPPKHLAYRGDTAEDGSFHAMEYLVEGRDQGSTVLRFVHNGMISDDWGDEYLAQSSHGWDMYLHTLGQYLQHFTGLPGTYVHVQGPPAAEGADAWSLLLDGLGVTEPINEGDTIRLTPAGLAPIEGVVDWSPPGFRGFLGVRGAEGLYRFHGGGPSIGIGHHVFAGSGDAAAWEKWINGVFS